MKSGWPSFAAKPGHRGRLVREPRRDQEYGLCSACPRSRLPPVPGRSTVAETSSRLRKIVLAGGLLVLPANPIGQQSVQGAGHEGDLQVEVDLHAHHRRRASRWKRLDRLGDAVLDQHALGVAGHQRRARRRRLLVRRMVGSSWPRSITVICRTGPYNRSARLARPGHWGCGRGGVREGKVIRRQADAVGSRSGPASSACGVAGSENRCHAGSTGEDVVSRQLRIEDQFARQAAGAFLPEVGEAKDSAAFWSLGIPAWA